MNPNPNPNIYPNPNQVQTVDECASYCASERACVAWTLDKQVSDPNPNPDPDPIPNQVPAEHRRPSRRTRCCMVKVPPWQCPDSAPVLPQHSQEEAEPPGAQPLLRGLELPAYIDR